MAARLPMTGYGHRTLLGLLIVILVGCRPATPPPSPADQTQAAPSTATVPAGTPTPQPGEAEELRNSEYQLGATDGLRIVSLTDGRFQQGRPGEEDYVSVALTDFIAIGDLNADGRDEVAGLISESYGGTGVFVFLAVYQRVNDRLVFQASRMVDDRPQLNALSIGSGEIFLDAVIHGPDEPMCCPTLRTTHHYRLIEGQLELIDYTTFTPDGRPRTITIESPVDGGEVFSSVPIKGSVAIAPFENNLVFRIYDVSSIELAAGPIPVTAAEPGAPGTFDAVIPLGNILSGAIIRIEVQDLSAADGSLLAMDSVELVVK